MYPWLSDTYEQLISRVKKHSLHHGLLIQGVDGVGKSDFCVHLAKSILCKSDENHACGQCQSCKLYEAQSHPDLYRLETDKQVGVDLVRDAITKLSTTSQLSGNKVLIMEAADSMTDSAANALLKTLEEPTDNTYLLLISSKSEALLPTIRSRCEKVTLSCSKSDDCIAWLKAQGIDSIEPKLLKLYQNSPLTLREHLAKREGLTYASFLENLDSLQHKHNSALQLAEQWQDEAPQVVLWMQYWVADKIKSKLQDNQKVWDFHHRLLEYYQSLQNPGVNRILVLCAVLNHVVDLN